jgi:hypothetical protein
MGMKNTFLFKILFLLLSLTSFSSAYSQSDVRIGTWNGEIFSYDFTFSTIQDEIEAVFEDSLGMSGTIDSLTISDPDPSNDSSVAYLVYKFSEVHGEKITFGHRIMRRLKESVYEYYLDIHEISGYDEQIAARAYKCTMPENCGGCDPKRGGFLGLGAVYKCDCTESTVKDCNIEITGGSAFPWAAVISFITAAATIIYNHNN